MPAPDPQAGVVERGKWLFRQQGCFLCHGPEGRGGVPNRNYLKDTIPLLAVAEWMKLEPEDVTSLLEPLRRGVRLETLEGSAPVPQFTVVLAQSQSMQALIRNGNPAGRKDPRQPAPPLNVHGRVVAAWRMRTSTPSSRTCCRCLPQSRSERARGAQILWSTSKNSPLNWAPQYQSAARTRAAGRATRRPRPCFTLSNARRLRRADLRRKSHEHESGRRSDVPRAAMTPLQTIWDCRWSRFNHRPGGTRDLKPPDSLWVCVREPGIRRPVTEDECADCAYWEPQEELTEH